MGQVVVEAEIGPLRIHERDIVAGCEVAPKGLLHTKCGFQPANKAILSAEGLEPVSSFDPVASRVFPPAQIRIANGKKIPV